MIVQASILFFAGAAAGAINSVAGGGSFVTFPALLLTGVAPVTANATSTVALWPGTIASAIAYRSEVRAKGRSLVVLGAASLVGGLIGAVLLLRTSDAVFVKLIPWLLLLATLILTFGGAMSRRDPAASPARGLLLPAALQLVVAIYGGYFGGGASIMMLGVLSLLGEPNIHTLNGMKTFLGTTVNSAAVVTFIVSGNVAWRSAVIVAVGAVVGGYLGAWLARRIEPRLVKRLVLVLCWGMTAYFLAKAYLPGLRA